MSQAPEILTGTIEGEAGLVSLPTGVTLLQLFTEPEHIDPLLAKIAEEVRNFKADPYTEAGRKAIASLAYKVSRVKSFLDGKGKDLVDEYKEVPKKIDATRKRMRDLLDALKVEARKDLDQWEAGQERIAAQRKAQEEAAALAKEIEFLHEIALLQNAEFDRKKEEAARLAEQQRLEREDQLRREGEERARREALQREQDALEAQQRAEREAAEAEQRAKDAEARALQAKKEADERAEQAAIEAQQRERARQDAEARREADERAAKERDIEHRRKINAGVVAALREHVPGLTEDQAKEVVKAVAQSKVRHLSIAYHEAAA